MKHKNQESIGFFSSLCQTTKSVHVSYFLFVVLISNFFKLCSVEPKRKVLFICKFLQHGQGPVNFCDMLLSQEDFSLFIFFIFMFKISQPDRFFFSLLLRNVLILGILKNPTNPSMDTFQPMLIPCSLCTS